MDGPTLSTTGGGGPTLSSADGGALGPLTAGLTSAAPSTEMSLPTSSPESVTVRSGRVGASARAPFSDGRNRSRSRS